MDDNIHFHPQLGKVPNTGHQLPCSSHASKLLESVDGHLDGFLGGLTIIDGVGIPVIAADSFECTGEGVLTPNEERHVPTRL